MLKPLTLSFLHEPNPSQNCVIYKDLWLFRHGEAALKQLLCSLWPLANPLKQPPSKEN